MPFCPNCGTEVGENEKFCSNCGNPIQGDEKAARKSSVQASSPKVTNSSRKTNKLIWIIVPVILIVIAAVFFLWPDNKIEFVDKNLEEAVRLAIGKTDGVIKKKDVEGLVELDVSGSSIESLEGIEKLTSLQVLNLSDNKITDISPLVELPNLKELYIEGNDFDISDNSPARKLISELKQNGVEVNWIITFARTYGEVGGIYGDIVLSVQQTKDRGFILLGAGEVIKTDEKGNKEWSNTFDNYGNNIIISGQQTKDGGYILAGTTDNRNDGWLIKLDANREKEWSQTFSGYYDDVILSVQQTGDGGYILAGGTDTYSSRNVDGWLIKTDRNGNKQWSQIIFGSDGDDAFTSVQQTNDGGYILAGFKDTYVKVGEGWVIKTDEKGNKEWSRNFSGNYEEEIFSIQQTKDGGYIFEGSSEVIKLDEKGNELWSKAIDIDTYMITSVTQTYDGGYIVAGSMISSKSGEDGWLMKIDEKGNELWSKTYGGDDEDIFRSIQQTDDGGYIIAGHTESKLWLIKTDEEGNITENSSEETISPSPEKNDENTKEQAQGKEEKENVQKNTSDASANNKPIIIKFSHVVSEDTPKGQAAKMFEKLAEKYTDGKVDVQVFPSSLLYNDNDVLNAIRQNNVQLAVPATSKVSTLYPEWQVFDLPFAFKDSQQIEEAMNSRVGDTLYGLLETQNIKGLAIWDNGFKHMTSNKSQLIKTEDFTGQSFRVMASEILEAQFEAVGANSTPMPFSEVYNALDNGVIDGQENTLSNIYSKKFHEVQKYMTLSKHGYLGYAVITNKEFWNGLPDDVRTELERAMDETTKWVRENADIINDENLKKIKADNPDLEIHVLTDEEKQAWMKRMDSTYDWLRQQLIAGESKVGNELIDAIFELRD